MTEESRVGVADGSSSGGMPSDVLERIYEREAPALLRLLWLFNGDRAAAEDFTQDAFVRLHRAWPRLRDEARAGAYLRSIGLNLARSHARRGDVAARIQREPRREAVSAEATALLADSERRLLAAVQTLPERQRACVLLRYYADLEPRLIAETLTLSVNSVKTHLRRGLEALEQRLGGDE